MRIEASGAALEPVDVVAGGPKLVPHSKLPPAPGRAFEGPGPHLAGNGIEIGYRQFGHGPDLFMVTGDTAPMSLWRLLVAPFGAALRRDDLRQPRRRLHHRRPSRPITVPLMARDTAGLEVGALELTPLVGWSMGW